RSCFLALPTGVIASFTLPPATGWLRALTPLPDNATVPGPGRFTTCVPVPFFLFRFSLPKLKAFEGAFRGTPTGSAELAYIASSEGGAGGGGGARKEGARTPAEEGSGDVIAHHRPLVGARQPVEGHRSRKSQRRGPAGAPVRRGDVADVQLAVGRAARVRVVVVGEAQMGARTGRRRIDPEAGDEVIDAARHRVDRDARRRRPGGERRRSLHPRPRG